MTTVDFYQTHLNRVSRSFAACIARLESPLRAWVGLTYLLCRILDTVEDALWARVSLQMKSFEQLLCWLEQNEGPTSVSEWVTLFPAGLPEGEKLLLSDTSRLLSDLKEAPPEVRGPIIELIRAMTAGMRHFAKLRDEGGGRLRLKGLKELNQYCFFVAGIVGETLSRLLAAVDANVRLTKSVLVDAHHFGLFLQKVNILKDQARDEVEGRFLVPSQEEVYSSLEANAEGAMRYIESVPLARKDYRVFCAWSLFLGLATLPLVRAAVNAPRGPNDNSINKLARSDTQEIFSQVELAIGDEQKLRKEFSRLISAIKGGGASAAKVAKAAPGETSSPTIEAEACLNRPAWIKESYRGLLDDPSLRLLGLI